MNEERECNVIFSRTLNGESALKIEFTPKLLRSLHALFFYNILRMGT